ncbi:hypothetical protein Goshw_028197 [Gossypium schwendimanii]|uniref:Integrase DNA-binding domain-containing protein n=1 Tax=Gossypium schwendimanii TaxID=34291 RepID=A0A7J9MWI3_GOSSC|nr:hypothetical protein [Gossypium schwendimanii]
MKWYVSGQKVGIFFPHFVLAFCKSVEVPMDKNEQFMKQKKSIIGDSLYTHYVEVKRKKFLIVTKEGKKRWTFQYHLNRKNSRELGEGALNYPPDMLGRTRTHLKAEDEATSEDKGEEDEHNLLRDEDKYEAAFQL